MKVSRREMLKWGAGTAALGAIAWNPQSVNAMPAKKQIPLGLQLYSVRKDAAKDLAGVLEAVAKMGFEGVEFAGYYGHGPKAIRKMLDDNGLKCCGTHTHIDALTGDRMKHTVELHKTLGTTFIIVPWLPHKYLADAKSCAETGKLFTELAGKLKGDGMRIGYHAHGGDFQKHDGQTAWDILFAHARPDVIMQLDVGNCLGGGGDPYATLEKFPGRAATIHLKEHGGKRGAVLGEGDVDWKRIFKLCETIGGTQWYVVEQEGYGDTTPLESVKRCLQNLKKMGK